MVFLLKSFSICLLIEELKKLLKFLEFEIVTKSLQCRYYPYIKDTLHSAKTLRKRDLHTLKSDCWTFISLFFSLFFYNSFIMMYKTYKKNEARLYIDSNKLFNFSSIPYHFSVRNILAINDVKVFPKLLQCTWKLRFF